MKEPNKTSQKERVTSTVLTSISYSEEDRFKLAVINDLYKYLSVSQTIIFCNVKRSK